MPAEKYDALIKNEQAFAMWGFVFYTTSDNYNVVARCNGEGQIIDLHRYKDKETTVNDLTKIKEGMTPEQVVKLVGVPLFDKNAHSASGTVFDFKTDDGIVFSVGWHVKQNGELYVAECITY